MKIGFVGLGKIFGQVYNILKENDQIEIVALCDNDKDILKEYEIDCFKTTDFKELVGKCDYVAIFTPPDTHLEIASFFLKNDVKVLLEKPNVVSLKQLKKLKKEIKNKRKFYNLLHFSFGEEILWAKENLKLELPKEIKAYTYDDYVENNKIKVENISQCGAYLDEVINPLSAIVKLFGKAKFVSLTERMFFGDKYAYYAQAKFKIKNCKITFEADWSLKQNHKYIDLIYDDRTIRLDSSLQSVIDLSSNEILFQGEGNRIQNHYRNTIKDFLTNKENFKFSFELHKQLLKPIRG